MTTPISPGPEAAPASIVPSPVRYADPPVPEGRFPLGRRRLKDIPRALQRPLECQLQSLRRQGGKSTGEISSRLDLHPDDIEALAATGGRV